MMTSNLLRTPSYLANPRCIILSLALSLAVAGTVGADPVPVTVTVPRIGTLRQIERTTGELKAVRRANLEFKVPGTIASMTVSEGDRVQQGQTLAQLELANAQLGVDQAAAGTDIADRQIKALQAALEAARVLEKQAVIRLDLARRESERAQTLRSKESMSIQQFDQIDGQFKLAQNGLEAAQRQIAQAESALGVAQGQRVTADVGLRLARKHLTDSTLTAPFGGVIVAKMRQEHETVRDGTVVTLVDDSRLELTAPLPERYFPLVKRGTSIRCKTPLAPTSIAATVTVVIPSIDPVSRSFIVKAVIDNADHVLSHGGYADVEVIIREDREVCVLPEAIVQSARDDATAGRGPADRGPADRGPADRGPASPGTAGSMSTRPASVLVFDKGKARRVAVSLGVSSLGEVAVIDGLSPDTTVISSGFDRVTDGADVAVNASGSAPTPPGGR